MPKYLKHERVRVRRKKGKKIPRNEIQSVWEQRILEAEAHKQRWKEEFQVDALEKAYYGHQKPEDWTAEGWFTINLLFASAKIMKRNVCPRQLQVRLELARTFKLEPDAIMQMEQITSLREAVLNYHSKQLELWRTGQICYLNALYQFGVVKVGYSAEMEDNENAGALIMHEGKIMRDRGGIPMLEPEVKTKSEEFFVDEIDPDCFLVDRYCQNSISKTGRWVAQKIFRPLEDVQNDELYPVSRTRDLGPSALMEAEKEYLMRSEQYKSPYDWESGVPLPENELVVLYEVYDLRERQVLTVARGAQKLLRDPGPLPRGVLTHPFVTLKFYERRGDWYPIPLVFNLMGPQYEYNVTRNQTALHRRRFNRKYAYLDGAIDPDELTKLTDGNEDGMAVKINREGALQPIADARLDPAVYTDTGLLRREIMEMSGVGDLQRAQTGAESATEAEIVERRAREGEIDEHEEMMGFISIIVQKLHDSMEANLTIEGAVKSTGPNGSNWVSFGPEHFESIAGQVLFNIIAEEMSRMTLQVERAQLLQLLDILGKNPLLCLNEALLRSVVDKFPALADNEPLIAGLKQVAMVQLQMQMGQMQQKQAGGGGQKPAQKTGQVAGSSRKVATGR